MPPVLQHHGYFFKAEEQLPVEELGAKAGMEALHMAILPRRTGIDVGTTYSGFLQPGLNPERHELRAVVAAQPLRPAPRGHQQFFQTVDHAPGRKAPGRPQHHALTAVFIDDRKYPHRPAIRQRVLDEGKRSAAPLLTTIQGPVPGL